MYKNAGKIHLIGIGGIGMSGIAELLKRNGYEVSGSDLSRSETVRHLESLGIKVFHGHDRENIEGAGFVVFSSAVRPDNPEFQAATELGIPTVARAEMLAELMRVKSGIAVAGAHGKTTTTSMVGLALMKGGLDPTIVVGGRMDNFGGTNARLGSGEFMVAEADESDGSFNRLSPCIAVVTNLDREHMDFYGNMRRLKDSFVSFLNKVPFYGLSVFCGDDPHLKLIRHRLTRRKVSYGFEPHNDYQILRYESLAGESCSEIRIGSQKEELRLQVPGRHNALNALAALAVADELAIPRANTFEGLRSFQGVQRRFQKRGERGGVVFVDDYAHHPTEIKATLLAARERYPKAKIRVVFQPHRYSRTEDLFDDFPSSFRESDSVTLTEIYAAGEPPIPGVSSRLLAENFRQQGLKDVRYVETAREAVESCISQSAPGDVVLTLGAGDLPSVYRDLF